MVHRSPPATLPSRRPLIPRWLRGTSDAASMTDPAQMHETHGSVVLLVGDRAATLNERAPGAGVSTRGGAQPQARTRGVLGGGGHASTPRATTTCRSWRDFLQPSTPAPIPRRPSPPRVSVTPDRPGGKPDSQRSSRSSERCSIPTSRKRSSDSHGATSRDVNPSSRPASRSARSSNGHGDLLPTTSSCFPRGWSPSRRRSALLSPGL